jgi:DNA-binding IclR family transcriptional regulator
VAGVKYENIPRGFSRESFDRGDFLLLFYWGYCLKPNGFSSFGPGAKTSSAGSSNGDLHSTLGPVTRTLNVLRFMSECGRTSIREASAALKLAPSTVHRLLDILVRDGMVERDKVERCYSIGPELFRIAAKIVERYDIRTLSLPVLREVVALCDETCFLGLYLPIPRKMIFAEKADSSQLLRYQLPMNIPMSVLWGASGLAILAYLPEDQIDLILAEEGPAPSSGEALPSRATLDRQIARIKACGFVISHGQKIAGAVGISAPVFGVNGTIVGSLGITVPQSKLKAPDERRLGLLLSAKAAALSSRLGGPLNSPWSSKKTGVNRKQPG